MKKFNFVVLVWLALLAMVLVWTVNSYQGMSDEQLKTEVVIRHALITLVLTFPSGWLGGLLVESFAFVFDLTLSAQQYAQLLTLVCGLAGYLQWFVLVPWVWRRWKSHRSQSVASH